MAEEKLVENFTRDVLSGKVRKYQWGLLLERYFPADSHMESWKLFDIWAGKHGIQWRHFIVEKEGKKHIWVTMLPPRGKSG